VLVWVDDGRSAAIERSRRLDEQRRAERRQRVLLQLLAVEEVVRARHRQRCEVVELLHLLALAKLHLQALVEAEVQALAAEPRDADVAEAVESRFLDAVRVRVEQALELGAIGERYARH